MTALYMSDPPFVIIVIRFESRRPVVQIGALYEHDELRLRLWLAQNPGIERLVDDAVELARRERAA